MTKVSALITWIAATAVLVACGGPNYPAKCAELKLGQAAEKLPLRDDNGFFYSNSTAVEGPIEDLNCCYYKRTSTSAATTPCKVDCNTAPYADVQPHKVDYPYTSKAENRSFDEDGTCKIWVSGGKVVARAFVWN